MPLAYLITVHKLDEKSNVLKTRRFQTNKKRSLGQASRWLGFTLAALEHNLGDKPMSFTNFYDEENIKIRKGKMPTVETAVAQMDEAHKRLKELGFHDMIHAPKDGTKFEGVLFEGSGKLELKECFFGHCGLSSTFCTETYDGQPQPAAVMLWRKRQDRV